MRLHTEIHEQPACLANLLENQRPACDRIAAAIREADPHYVFLAARGTSDNAGRYANYLWGAHNGLPVALAAPSLFTYYQQPPRLRRALVVGISQSGQSPDIVSVLAEGRRQGNPTLAITNEPDSPLAEAADFVIDLGVGLELAVAATKTYSAELLAVAMLSTALDGSAERWRELERLPGWLAQVLEQDEAIAGLVQRYVFMQQCVVLGRGYNYATAFEWALKLKELAYVGAEPYSSADFQHGPMALVVSGFPVLAVIPQGKVYASMKTLLERLRHEYQAELVVISNDDEARALAQSAIALPAAVPEWLTPLVGIAPAQLFVYHLARARGYDTEKPRNIRKVTETR